MIGDRIKARREELGMTQEELAEKVGYKHKTSISRIEKNKSDIFQSDIVKFAKALDTTPAHLMGWENIDEQSLRSTRRFLRYRTIIEAYKSADEKTRDIVNRLLDIDENNDELLELAAARPNANPNAGDSDFPENDIESMKRGDKD